ncbi:hypothetical protein HZY97_01890 [Sphingomonas sp. R-74633]|uniref:DMP19 family protein n=1 Tax=Sphingomonas sp. R-74633 TaxID=2751188 RepID=UPI0015D0FB73|nr:hypothetical protein [Sphingomonas sp. R-74633]NYT39494.1 hypothetical protein [Sphingomonas sp. R-74633]
MTETRPEMTAAEFEAAASYQHPGWCATGESFVHVPAVMQIEGWDLYGHPGNDQLTEPQRALMMWSDLVGQVSNGGFTQFIDNYRVSLKLAYRLIALLDWPELMARFDPAFRERAGDPEAPVARIVPNLNDEPEKWAASRARLIRHLAKQGKSWWQPVTQRDIAWVEARNEDWQLQIKYQAAVVRGELTSGGEAVFDFVPPDEDASNAFDDWLYAPETKAASLEAIRAFALANRDALCRLRD